MRKQDKFGPHQFLARARLHVIGVRVCILQCVATLEIKGKTVMVGTCFHNLYFNVPSRGETVPGVVRSLLMRNNVWNLKAVLCIRRARFNKSLATGRNGA